MKRKECVYDAHSLDRQCPRATTGLSYRTLRRIHHHAEEIRAWRMNASGGHAPRHPTSSARQGQQGVLSALRTVLMTALHLAAKYACGVVNVCMPAGKEGDAGFEGVVVYYVASPLRLTKKFGQSLAQYLFSTTIPYATTSLSLVMVLPALFLE